MTLTDILAFALGIETALLLLVTERLALNAIAAGKSWPPLPKPLPPPPDPPSAPGERGAAA